MHFEIDFLPVGSGAKSGDAICLRYSADGCNTWTVGIIDGGTQESGEKMCEFIQTHYGTKNVDFVVCSHPDQDHASGLALVMENLNVKKLLMHCPWLYIDRIYEFVNDGRVTKESLKKRLAEGHPYAYSVYEAAVKKNIPVFHPFSDINDHGVPCLVVAGPSIDFYLNQIKGFRSVGEITESMESDRGLLSAALDAAKKAVNWVSESWDKEILVDPTDGATSSENQSSVISYFIFGDRRVLFTADAGVSALENAANHIESSGHKLDFNFIQVPHHGSKRNIGPSILNRLVGKPKLIGANKTFSAFISASPDGHPKHPNKRVVNALHRRGGKVIATQGTHVYYYTSGTPDRGWGAVEPLPFYDQVEDDD